MNYKTIVKKETEQFQMGGAEVKVETKTTRHIAQIEFDEMGFNVEDYLKLVGQALFKFDSVDDMVGTKTRISDSVKPGHIALYLNGEPVALVKQ